MKKQKKSGVLYTLFLVLLLIVVSLTGTSEAGVQLKGYTDNSNAYQYVLFGHYPQLQVAATPVQPIAWRVLSADQSGTSKKALMLSDKNLDAMAFHASSNVWKSSALQTWMNGTGAGQFKNVSYFTTSELGAVSDDTHITKDENGVERPGTISGGNAGDSSSTDSFFALSYQDLLNTAYGFASGTGADLIRVALNTAYTASKPGMNSAGTAAVWWTRSPVSSSTYLAWDVDVDGFLRNGAVDNSAVAARPACLLNLESVIFKSASNDFAPGTPPAGVAGQISNPYLLVLPNVVPTGAPAAWTTEFISADKAPNGAQINGKNMIVSWDVDISPAVKRWPAPGDFKLSTGESPTSVTSDDANPKLLKLTFATGVAAGATVTLSYNLNTDAISCDLSGTPSVEVVDSFANFVVSNDTPSGGGGGGGGGTTLSKETTPTGVGVTLGGKPYAAQTQTDGTYLITLPSGTDLKAIKLSLTLPTGATISPDLSKPLDFASEGTKKFTITAQDGTTKKEITITITASAEPPTEKAVLAVNASDCEVLYTTDKEGKITVEIRIPFASGATPSDLESLMLALKNSGLSGIKFAYVNADGTVVPYSSGARAAATKAPYLRITGTAPSVASLANEAITTLSYKTKGSATQYIQTFPNGGLKLSAMNVTDNTKKESGSSSGGCNAGAGTAALLAMGIVVLGLNKAGVRKKK